MIHKRVFLVTKECSPKEFRFLIRISTMLFYMALRTRPFSS